jgi:DNA-binding Lrp family transcriptional regulator
MPRPLNDIDARLLNLLQKSFPLVPQPFAALASQLNLPESEVLQRISALRSPPNPIIRQISAIFDTKSLGYQSTLVAARIPAEDLDHAVNVINAHPGVTHNYLRNHPFSLWYTLAVPPDSRLGLERTLQLLHAESHAIATRMFPTLKLYKIGVSFDLSPDADLAARSSATGFTESDRAQAMAHPITDADKRIIRVLQQDLPITARPFDAWAEQAHVTTDQLLAAAQTYLAQKRMRRFAAVLHHRQAGFAANGMGVWVVPPEKQDAFGSAAASFAAVSHCYLRPTYEDWPYSIFTMVHAPTQDECNAVLAAISTTTGITDYSALYSSKEFKKTRLRYFTEEIEAWEQSRL